MNEQTLNLINQLSEKLGTTSEYLWGVLIKQAPIDAIVNLFSYFIFILIGVGLYYGHKFIKKCELYDEEPIGFIMVIISVIYALLFMIFTILLPSDLLGLYNPEYWALKEILSTLNN